jgi:hypothetical protein
MFTPKVDAFSAFQVVGSELIRGCSMGAALRIWPLRKRGSDVTHAGRNWQGLRQFDR